jgi:DNA-binding NarL/FixJ family response regulator
VVEPLKERAMDKIRVLLAEDGDGEQATRLAVEQRPDAVLMDIAMPKLNGLEATKQIKARCPGTAVPILIAYDSDQPSPLPNVSSKCCG